MTSEQLQALEAELGHRGYRKYTDCLTSYESWAWFKTFGKEKDEGGYVVSGYQVAFRVWDFRKYIDRNALRYADALIAEAERTDKLNK